MTRIKEKKLSLSSLGDSRVVPVYINLGPILEKKKNFLRETKPSLAGPVDDQRYQRRPLIRVSLFHKTGKLLTN